MKWGVFKKQVLGTLHLCQNWVPNTGLSIIGCPVLFNKVVSARGSRFGGVYNEIHWAFAKGDVWIRLKLEDDCGKCP